MEKKAIVLWSGGKDCNLALHLARKQGIEIVALVTFHSPSTAFKAHPLEWMDLQSKSLGIPHLLFEIQEPFSENYEIQLKKLKDQLGIQLAVSGDISEVHGNSNWISDRAEAVGLETLLPLWHKDRKEVMHLLLETDFEVVITLVKEPWLNADFVGRRIDAGLLNDFEVLGKENGLDLCGEQGEYHTMILNGPDYRAPIKLNAFEVTKHDELFHFSELSLSLDTSLDVPTLEKHKICVTCGIPFSCYTQGCWCGDLPRIMPMDGITDRLCPVCLKAEINKRLVENDLEPIP